MSVADVLARTYFWRISAFRPLEKGGEAVVCRDAACALSRSAHTSAPTPPDGDNVLPEALYRLTLYTRPELTLQLGDRVEITDPVGRIYRGRASDSFCYSSHCVTVLGIWEVLAADGQNTGKTGEENGEVTDK